MAHRPSNREAPYVFCVFSPCVVLCVRLCDV